MFDWANQPFYTLIMTFVFAVYFTDVFITGDDGAQKLTLTQTISGVAIAIISPLLGSISDLRGNRKNWMAFFLCFTCDRHGITLVRVSRSP
jgi:UMF1 family MFS transporter